MATRGSADTADTTPRARPVRVAPSILSADFAHLGNEVKRVADAGADWVHVDVMDGTFVPNITFGPPVISAIRPLVDLPFDTHLMVSEPDRYLEDYADAGCTTITVHAEACTHLHRTLQRIGDLGCRRGVALNPATPLTAVEHVVQDLDLLLVMTVNPGFGGQRFIEACVPKVAEARRLLDEAGSDADLEIDGGANPETAQRCIDAGADAIVAGSTVFGYDGPMKEIVEALRGSGTPRA